MGIDEKRITISIDGYGCLCKDLMLFKSSTNNPEKEDYLSDGEWLDVFVELCETLKADIESVGNIYKLETK